MTPRPPPLPLPSRGRLRSAIAPTVWLAALPLLASGCQDLGQVAVLQAQSPVALRFGPVSLDAPDPEVAELLTSRDVERALAADGLTAPQIAAIEREVGDLRDLAAVDAAVGGIGGRGTAFLSDALLQRVADDVVDQVREELAEDDDLDELELVDATVRFDDDWGDFLLDTADPDESLRLALTSREMGVELVARSGPLRDLLADQLDEDDLDIIDDVFALDSVRTLALQELAVRTLFEDEIEPEGGFPDEQTEDDVEERLLRRGLVGPCGATQQVLDHPFSVAGILVDGPGDERLVFEGDLDPGAGRCGLRAPALSPVDLRDYYRRSFSMVITTRLTLDEGEVHLGGYLQARVVARLRLPGSIGELEDLGDGETDDGAGFDPPR